MFFKLLVRKPLKILTGNKVRFNKIKKYSASQYKTVEKFVQQYQNNDEWTKEMIFDRTKEIAKKMFEMVYN